ncbi:MAG: ferric reductase-like transmembrane domain-containing protein [Mangrovicoccus sp.]
MRGVFLWGGLAVVTLLPLILAATSPLLAWRQPVYIAAGLAGVIALALLPFQPLLAARALPGLSPGQSRKLHRILGGTLLALIIAHVIGLWITSPPDMIDALTFTAPTFFSVFGVLGMWMLFATAFLAMRRRHILAKTWRSWHQGLGLAIALCSILHAIMIQGSMEFWSKTALCSTLLAATIWLFRARQRRKA